jgi:metal-responsive CopG/Arc/MetJ family transcriptional regulator
MRGGHRTDLRRVGISLPADLLAQFDRLIAQKGYETRSEAVHDLMRGQLLKVTTERAPSELIGTVTMVYDRHTRQLPTRLIAFQHQQDGAVLATMQPSPLRGRARAATSPGQAATWAASFRHHRGTR